MLKNAQFAPSDDQPQSVVVDLQLYKKRRELTQKIVRSRVPLYVSHLEGRVDSPRSNLSQRIMTIEEQIEELNDLLFLLEDDNFETEE
ncbi:MAG: hypothetical protein OXC44_00850 [Proteobacteria bacterium]|nr:hypothetical protein [Pseudomonadota bacterium]